MRTRPWSGAEGVGHRPQVRLAARHSAIGRVSVTAKYREWIPN